jgi:hypothetical protein
MQAFSLWQRTSMCLVWIGAPAARARWRSRLRQRASVCLTWLGAPAARARCRSRLRQRTSTRLTWLCAPAARKMAELAEMVEDVSIPIDLTPLYPTLP